MEKFNLKNSDKWICIHNRDSAFKKKTYLNPKDEFEHSYRNFDINLMLDAAEYFTSLGYFVFRMGAIVEKPFKSSFIISNSLFIHYYTDIKNICRFKSRYL